MAMEGTQLARLCEDRGWTRARLMFELRAAAGRRQGSRLLPDDASLKRMIREWIHGRRGLSADYAALFADVFGTPFTTGRSADLRSNTGMNVPAPDELRTRLAAAASVDAGLIALLEGQTQSFRLLDRQLGASRLLQQTQGHIDQMAELWTHSLPGAHRSALAAAVAEAAALAGWQALDLGDADRSWALHEVAKTAARESETPSIVAHVTAQQAYALLDLDRSDEAVSLMRYARQEAGNRVPGLVRSWLWAAEAEALAAAGGAGESQAALDQAAAHLPAGGDDAGLPFLFLDEVHLGRWRGHCLARLGMEEAVQELTTAVSRLDPTFARAAAALRCDLATAYSVRGQHEEARAEARAANELATRTASARQRRRISHLLTSGMEPLAR